MSREYDPAAPDLDRPVVRPRRAPLPARQVAPPPDEYDYDAIAETPRRSSGVVIGILVVGGLAALILMVMIFNNINRPAQAVNGTGANTAALLEDVVTGARAVDFTAQTLDGKSVRLSDYRGKQPVWLNFWASWCGPCKAEMPAMEELHQAYKDKGLVMLGFDVAEPKATVDDFVKSRAFSWIFLVEENGQTANRYQTTGIPTHVFINKDGVITNRISSGLPKDYMEAEVKKLLGIAQ
jgi:thiol-disulfide isomerase/thioredoxin